MSAAGKRADRIAFFLGHEVLKPPITGMNRFVLASDDTPTPRYGPLVRGAGLHHNPCPGPANNPFVCGHVWVALGLLVTHPTWGVIAPPQLARLYVRKKDLPAIDKKHRPEFRTKLALAVELVRWAKDWLDFAGKPMRVVADGAYAKAAFLQPLIGMGVVAVGRLGKDSALWTVPMTNTGKRGRPRKYGENRIESAKRAGQKGGRATGTFGLYGKTTEKKDKTFEATWRPAGGVIRVVLVSEGHGRVAFSCTDRTAGGAEILGLVADRFSRECTFRDCKEVVGAGQQQVRHLWASAGSFHRCLWTFTMTEVWAWGRDTDGLVSHRSASPWDDKPRRPSHADKRRAWQRELPAEEFEVALRVGADSEENRKLAERLLNLVA